MQLGRGHRGHVVVTLIRSHMQCRVVTNCRLSSANCFVLFARQCRTDQRPITMTTSARNDDLSLNPLRQRRSAVSWAPSGNHCDRGNKFLVILNSRQLVQCVSKTSYLWLALTLTDRLPRDFGNFWQKC